MPHLLFHHLKILATALILKLKLLFLTSILHYVIAIIFHLEPRHANAVLVNKLWACNFSPNVPQLMVFQLSKAASALLLKMAPKAALAILEELTTSPSPPWLSMLHLATAPLPSMEHSRELATAAFPMLNTCRLDKFAQLVVMLPAAFAIAPLMVPSIAIATAVSSSIQLPLMFLLKPHSAHASNSQSHQATLLTLLLDQWMERTQPISLPQLLFQEANALAALERPISSDRSVNVKIELHLWLSAANASTSPMELGEPINAPV